MSHNCGSSYCLEQGSSDDGRESVLEKLSFFCENGSKAVDHDTRQEETADYEKTSHLRRQGESTAIDLAENRMKTRHASNNWRNDMQRNDRKLKNVLIASLPLMAGILINGCATNAKTGSLIGAAVGAAAGQWIGKDTK